MYSNSTNAVLTVIDSGIGSSAEVTPANSPIKKSFRRSDLPIPEAFPLSASFFDFLNDDEEEIAGKIVNGNSRGIGSMRVGPPKNGREQCHAKHSEKAQAGKGGAKRQYYHKKKADPTCQFCKNNQMSGWEDHQCKDDYGRVVCPVLAAMVCPICEATGPNAHTRRYCPVACAAKMRELEDQIL